MKFFRSFLLILSLSATSVSIPMLSATEPNFEIFDGSGEGSCNLPAPTNLTRFFPNSTTVHHSWNPVSSAWGYYTEIYDVDAQTTQSAISTNPYSDYTVVQGHTYNFKVYPMCTSNSSSKSGNGTYDSFRATYIVIDLVVNFDGCQSHPGSQFETISAGTTNLSYTFPSIFSSEPYLPIYFELVNNNVSYFGAIQKINGTRVEIALLQSLNPNAAVLGGVNLNGMQGVVPAPYQSSEAHVCESAEQLNQGAYLVSFKYTSSSQGPQNITISVPSGTLYLYRTCGQFTDPSDSKITDRGFEGSQKFEIKPINPFSDELTLHYSGTPSQPMTLRLLDMTGRTVRNEMIKPDALTGNSISIPTEDLTPGVYFLHMEIEPGNFVTRKVVKI